MDFKVKCVRYVGDSNRRFTVGKVYSVINGKLIDDYNSTFEAWSLSMNGNSDFEALKKWFARYYDFELVEDKKVFTKDDLKTGMFGVTDSDDKFVVVGERLIYWDGDWDSVSSLTDDLCFFDRKITKVYDNLMSFKGLDRAIKDTSKAPVYDRERDTKKPLYNGKVVCIDLNGTNKDVYTVGKIYQFKDGILTDDEGDEITNWNDKPFESFEAFTEFSGSKWLEIKE